MNFADQILKIANNNNGVVTSAQVTKDGILRQHLKVLVDKGLLEHSGRGLYIIPTVFDDEMFNLQMRFKRGIFSHETALFLLDLTDRTPIKYSLTFPLGYNTTALNSENVKYYRVKDIFYEIGITNTKSPGGKMMSTLNAKIVEGI